MTSKKTYVATDSFHLSGHDSFVAGDDASNLSEPTTRELLEKGLIKEGKPKVERPAKEQAAAKAITTENMKEGSETTIEKADEATPEKETAKPIPDKTPATPSDRAARKAERDAEKAAAAKKKAK